MRPTETRNIHTDNPSRVLVRESPAATWRIYAPLFTEYGIITDAAPVYEWRDGLLKSDPVRWMLTEWLNR